LYANKNIKKERILSYKTQDAMISAVEHGSAEAFLEDDFFVDIVNQKLKKKFDIYKTNEKTSIALAFRKNSVALREAFNAFLKTWKEKGLYKKWSEYFFKKMLWMKEKKL
jgi:ABC-type amino acid transport substrate-binding protein